MDLLLIRHQAAKAVASQVALSLTSDYRYIFINLQDSPDHKGPQVSFKRLVVYLARKVIQYIMLYSLSYTYVLIYLHMLMIAF